jgi:hypothetical protein
MRRYSNDSKNAALAAWAAWDQGKFWEMHDLIFENAPVLDRSILDQLARDLGLDMERFRKAMDEQTHLSELQENIDRIHKLDIWSTPTAIINGRVIKGAQPYEKYREAVDEALGGASRLTNFRPVLAGLAGILSPPEAFARDGVFGQGKVPLYVEVPEARPTNELKPGDEAPDFTLAGVDDKLVTLSDFRGSKNVLLTFLPAAFTPV